MAHPPRELTPSASPRHYFGAELRRLREQAGLSAAQLGDRVHYSGDLIAKIEKAERRPKPALTAALDAALSADGALTRLLPLLDAQQSADGAPPRLELVIGQLREDVTDMVAGEALTGATLDDWERIVGQHGRATRYKPGRLLLDDLLRDFTELRRLLEHRRSASTARALTRTVAHLSGLLSLTLIKLGRAASAKDWARTARIAADEADDPDVRAWVGAQDAYVDYYRDDLFGALATARDAQSVSGATASVGAALGAALEARVHAALQHRKESQRALGRAEEILSHLTSASTEPSAFGYNEAQLRFHSGSALTHLGDYGLALKAQERALELYPLADYTDRALVRLDQARCIALEGDPSAASTIVIQTLTELDVEQRVGLISLYARELLAVIPPTDRRSTWAVDLQELLQTLGSESESI